MAAGGINPYPALRNDPFFSIEITHLPTYTAGKTIGSLVSPSQGLVRFEGWVTQFTDSYAPSWNSEAVYGRMDPLATFQGTRRTIQLNFDIVNDSYEHGYQNLQSIDQFLKFLYPVYQNTGLGGGSTTSVSQQTTLAAGPLLGLRWTNLVSNPSMDHQKLIGYIDGAVAYSPDLNEGGFILTEDKGPGIPPQPALANGQLSGISNYVPKKVSLGFSFVVLHTHLVGWAPSGNGKYVFGGDAQVNADFPHRRSKVQASDKKGSDAARQPGSTPGRENEPSANGTPAPKSNRDNPDAEADKKELT